MLLASKRAGFGLDRNRRALAVIGVERGRHEETFDGELCERRPVVRRDDMRRTALGKVECRIRPFAVFAGTERMDGAHHVLEDACEDGVASGSHVFDRPARIRREQDRIGRLVRLDKALDRECDQRALWNLLAIGRSPRIARGEDQIAAGCAVQPGAQRQRQLDRRVVGLQIKIFIGEGCKPALDQRDRAVRPAQHEGPCGNIRFGRFVNRLRRVDRLAAMPDLHDARIARFRHRARSEIRGKQDRVRVEPGRVGFRDRQREAVCQERLCVRIEFAHGGGVAAAG